MFEYLSRFTHWLHGQWPSGTVEKLPLIHTNGATNIPGTYVVGDLTGIPLLKFSSDSGAKAVQDILQDSAFKQREDHDNVFDVIIIGGGVSGYSAALEAKKNALKFIVIEASDAFSTIANFPKSKPIYTYPSDMTPVGELKFDEDVPEKESLLLYLRKKVEDAGIQSITSSVSHLKRSKNVIDVILSDDKPLQAHRAIIAIGRSGNYRQLDIPGFDSEKVLNRLHDPQAYSGKNIVVVGGGDSALETAVATADAGAHVTLSYRKKLFSRAKIQNIKKVENFAEEKKITLELGTQLSKIDDHSVTFKTEKGEEKSIKNDYVFSMLGREAPLNFFRRSGILIAGESTFRGWLWLAAFLVFATALYDWKSYGFLHQIWNLTTFPTEVPDWIAEWGVWWEDQVDERSTLIGTLAMSMTSRSFYYTLLYTACIGIFGWVRIQRRKTPYVTRQTITLFLIQVIPLFLLPEIILPWLGYLGAFDNGVSKQIADSLFPSYISPEDLADHFWPDSGHPRAYWHAYGFILAWPLNVYNIFTPSPMWGWIVISVIQTFVIIPLIIYKWGKGAYCGWICSCGALAETLGDTQRHKMPHGPLWNKLNMLGQIILAAAFIMLFIRIGGWIMPDSWMNHSFNLLLKGENTDFQLVNPLSWKWTVDIAIAGILGVGLYFKYSGRVWCRFACPLAALMHIYARFSRFRIFSDKDKCISCNACTTVCHQGIDIMSFANKGKPMEDPQCVRCSACVQTCPTGVLSFGEIDTKTGEILRTDKLPASAVQMAELIQVKNVS